MKIRIKFKKDGVMKYIGHLDMMRYFQKCNRRAGIDISYTDGFSPHQVMSFASPLGVGLTSEGEYLDIEVNSTRTSKEAIWALNQVMVEGVEVLEYKELHPQAKKAMSIVAAADYMLYFKDNSTIFPQGLSAWIHHFLCTSEEIQITKQTKKGEKLLNIKPFIYELKVINSPQAIFTRLKSGSEDNVKPELVLLAFNEYLKKNREINFTFNIEEVAVHRIEVYADDPNTTAGFIPLGALGKDIV